MLLFHCTSSSAEAICGYQRPSITSLTLKWGAPAHAATNVSFK